AAPWSRAWAASRWHAGRSRSRSDRPRQPARAKARRRSREGAKRAAKGEESYRSFQISFFDPTRSTSDSTPAVRYAVPTSRATMHEVGVENGFKAARFASASTSPGGPLELKSGAVVSQ